MANYSRITLIGNVGQEPASKQAGSQNVVETSLAVNTKRGDQEWTNWYRLSFWGKQGETALQYIRKGEPLFVEGRLLVRDYTKADGTQGYSLEVTVSDFQLMGSRQQDGGGGQGGSYNAGQSSGNNGGGNYNRSEQPAAAPEPIRAAGATATADDDLPF